MTDNNARAANDAASADKGENIVLVQAASKNGADELQRIKRSLNSKKTWATRIMTQLDSRTKAFTDSAAKDNAEKTPATKIHLKKKAKDVLENESQLRKHQKDLEKLVEELRETLDLYPITGDNAEEAIQKVEADAFEYIDKIENVLNNHDVLLAEAESVSTAEASAPPPRNVSTPTVQVQQGDVFRDVTSLKPNFLEKGSNLMEAGAGQKLH